MEHGASRVAALGIGPDVTAFVEPEGYLVTRFIAGKPIPPEEMRRAETIARAARTLREIHDGPAIPGRFDSFRVVEAYCVTATAHGVRIPDAYSPAKETADAIERTRKGERPAPCHNDLLNANFIDDGERIRIVDWEYAGMGIASSIWPTSPSITSSATKRTGNCSRPISARSMRRPARP